MGGPASLWVVRIALSFKLLSCLRKAFNSLVCIEHIEALKRKDSVVHRDLSKVNSLYQILTNQPWVDRQLFMLR